MNKLSFAIIVVIITAGMLIYASNINRTDNDKNISETFKKFSSEKELADYIKNSRQPSFGYDMLMGMPVMNKMAALPSSMEDSAGASRDFSKTNVQVEGVDEADIVKTDGKYIYTVSDNKLKIIEAYPADNAKMASETSLKGIAREIFINEDKLVIFGYYQKKYSVESEPNTASKSMIAPSYYYGSDTFIDVFDISDRTKPILKRDLILSGDYYSSRMIGNQVYAIINMPVYYYEGPIPLPYVSDNGKEEKIAASDIFYFDYPEQNYNYINIISLDIKNDDKEYERKTILSGSTQNMYVSTENIYATFTSFRNIYTYESIVDNVIRPVLPDTIAQRVDELKKSNDTDKWEKIENTISEYTNNLNEMDKKSYESKAEEKLIEFEERMFREKEKTIIHKIGIKDGEITYKGQGEVPGTILNQFSMDENNGFFRIATTVGQQWGWRRTGSLSKNNIYVLDKDMKPAGSVEDLAPGESIYSVRFMGDRAYLVTFKKVDPLFVVDLKDSYNPKVLGKLKIPGYSDYLHPYDENHIIGIGKEAVEAEEGDFAWYQGVKLALFDVSDPENPKELAKYNIGDRGTDSFALHDHKAFLFDKEKKLLAIPITLAEIDASRYAQGKVPAYAYGDYVWQGAYVFSLDTENGFNLKGRVTHVEDDSLEKSGYYYYSEYSIKRSLYIDNTFYTISDKMVKMNDLGNMDEINKVSI